MGDFIHEPSSCSMEEKCDDEIDFTHVPSSCSMEERCDDENDFIHEPSSCSIKERCDDEIDCRYYGSCGRYLPPHVTLTRIEYSGKQEITLKR
jgi:hypothetical protein